MTYKELFGTAGNGIFASIFYADYPTQYAAIFGDTPAEKLALYSLTNFGQRTVIDAVTADTAHDIVSSVIAVNVQGWEKQAAAMLADYDVTNPTGETITRTESTTETETGNGTDTASNVPFNDNDFTDVDKQTQQETKNGTRETETTEKRTGIGANKNFSEAIAKEMELRRDNWRKNIIFAVVNEITLSIYV